MDAKTVEGAGLGAIFQEALGKSWEVINRGRKYPSTLKDYISTLEAMRPLVHDMVRHNQEQGRPRAEVEPLVRKMQDGDELVRRYSNKSLGNFLCFPYYQMQLEAGGESLKRTLSVDVQVQLARNIMEIRRAVMNLTHQSEPSNVDGLGTSFYGTPEKPHFVVGFDQLLHQLKSDLVEGNETFINLTGFGGSGKSTLAKKLCWHPQVLDKFKENIFFATFSKKPLLTSIIEELFTHFGEPKPEFRGNEDPGPKLRKLLNKVCECPTLLVLDDVHRGSEELVGKFKVSNSNLKILVTSRAELDLEGCISHRLENLSHEDSMSLFRHYAKLNDTCPQNEFADQVVRCCGGLPLILEITGKKLRGKPIVFWQIKKSQLSQPGGSLIDSDVKVLAFLQKCFYDLDDEPMVKECFKDLGLFPEDQMIPVPALLDIWTELHDLPEDFFAMQYIYDLTSRHLSTLELTREVANEADNYYNNHFLMQHDLLRELAIDLSNEKPLERRENLIIDINKNNHPELCSEPEEEGIISGIFRQLSISEKQKQVNARSISISSGEAFNSTWWSMKPDGAKVLVLNIGGNNYNLPGFIEYMRELKVLILINYGFHPSKIQSFELLGSLPILKRIRLQKVFVPPLCRLENLKKLSLHMCTIGSAFESCPNDALPNLVELNIDYCKDMVKLPAEICKICSLKQLGITNCHRLSELPEEIGNLENSEVLRLSNCSDLEKIPDSITKLKKLSLLDISGCINLKQLPKDFGVLCNLEKFYMRGCSRCELPDSVENLRSLKTVICDEDTAPSWEDFRSQLPNLTIKQLNAEISLGWLNFKGFKNATLS